MPECSRRTTNIASGHQDDFRPDFLDTIDQSRTLVPGLEQPVRATDFTSGDRIYASRKRGRNQASRPMAGRNEQMRYTVSIPY